MWSDLGDMVNRMNYVVCTMCVVGIFSIYLTLWIIAPIRKHISMQAHTQGLQRDGDPTLHLTRISLPSASNKRLTEVYILSLAYSIVSVSCCNSKKAVLHMLRPLAWTHQIAILTHVQKIKHKWMKKWRN